MLEHKSQYVFYMNQDGVVFNVYMCLILLRSQHYCFTFTSEGIFMDGSSHTSSTLSPQQ